MTLFGSPLVCHIGAATRKGGVCVHVATGRGEGGIIMNPTPDTPTLTIYTTPNCPSCRLTRQALDRAGITYEVIDLSVRPDLVEQMRSEGLLQAPILDDGTSRSAGFRPDRIRAIVDAATPERLTARGAQVHVPAQAAEVQAHRGRAL